MALHKSMTAMASEVIAEYLLTSQFCLQSGKPGGAYPATLLLLCVTNSFGSYLTGSLVTIEGKSQTITKGEPFRVLNHHLFGLHLTHKQIKVIEQSYRNRLSHNAIIGRGAFLLLTQAGAPFVFSGNGMLIRVGAFHRLVSRVWANFPKEQIALWEQRQFNYRPSSASFFRLPSSDELLPDELRALQQDYRRWKKKNRKNKKAKKKKRH